MKRLLAVEASAGSGKTFRLANRYISLLNVDNPVNIIAITFTNKAANEMKERIVKFLSSLGEDENVLDMITSELNITKKELLKRKNLLLKKFLTNDVSIQTIDSFINKILRKFSYFAGFRSNFNIGSDKREVIFDNFLKSLSDEEFKSLIYIAKKEEKFTSLISLFESLYEKDKELKIKSEKFKVKSEKIENLYKQIETIKNRFLLVTQECKQINNFFKKNIYDMLKVKTIPAFLENGSLKKVRGFKKCFEEWMDSEFSQLLELIREYFILQESVFFNNLFYFYEKYKAQKIKFKKEENLLDFKDIEHLVYALLCEEEIDREFLYFRLDSRINHILMDEFQDTSITQWEIFEPIIDEIASGVGRSEFRSFFYVGDTKQAIYRFRGGEKALFKKVAKRYEPFGLVREKLNVNFRSAKNIVEFVNEKFSLNELAKSENTGYVEVDEIEKENAFDVLYEKIMFLKQNGVKESDIAVLVYKNDDILEVAEFLKEKGIKTVSAKSALVLSQRSVKAIVSLMKYLNNKNLKIEKLNFLSLIGKKYTEDEIDIKIQRPLLMIKEIIDKYDLLDEASLKLLYHSRNYDTLFDFIKDIDNFTEEMPLDEFDGVVIMTIHKSKGLEFDNVIVMDRLSKENADKSNILFFYENAKLKDFKLKIQKREIIDKEYDFIKKNEEKLKYEDKLNTEYVAFTRAKNSLIILKRIETTKEGKPLSAFVSNLEKMKKGEIIKSKDEENKKQEKVKINLKNYGKQEVLDTQEEYKPNDFKAVYFGDAIHYAFECEDIEAVRNLYGDFCNIDEVEKVYKESKTLIPKGKKEIPFIYKGKTGRIDLLVECKEYEIIDYKSAKPMDESKYIKQVKHYIEAVEVITGKKAEGYLFYTDIKKRKKVE